MKTFRVVLPIDIDGKLFQFGQTVELDVETAKAYSHALVRVDEEEESK